MLKGADMQEVLRRSSICPQESKHPMRTIVSGSKSCQTAFSLHRSVLFRCGDVDVAESVSLIGGEPYKTYDAAEAAGVAWAGEHCADVLYVCRSDGTRPLSDLA